MTADLALYWNFDEADGSIAMDSAGQGIDGSYTGTTGTPSPSPVVPLVKFANPRSRAFLLANTQAVFATASAAIKPANDFSLSIWYRSTRTDTAGSSVGSELVNLSNDLILRLRPTQIEFSKRIAANSGVGTIFGQCFANVTGHLDGAWHHVAGVSDPAGMRLYLDGTLVCTNTQIKSVSYTQSSSQLWVGQHATVRGSDRFDGNLDEFRFYTRALTAADVAWLAAGGP